MIAAKSSYLKAREHTLNSNKKKLKLNAYMMRVFWTKAVIVQGIQEDVIAGFVYKMNGSEKPLQGKNVLRNSFPCYERNEFWSQQSLFLWFK